MSIKQRLKTYPSLYRALMSMLNAVNYFNIRFNFFFPRYRLSEIWKQRTALVIQCTDNARIPRVKDAGLVTRDHQVMHNGLKITLGSYYDYGNTILLQQNKGVHEPQEEYVFQEVLERIPEGGTMMELGSYWAFYSMWFASKVKNSQCFMVEPDPHKMNFGQLNFKLNHLAGNFLLGYVSNAYKPGRIPYYSVDHLMKQFNLEKLSVLHSDIQGYEVKMLEGSAETLAHKKVDFLFISTHSNELHESCKSLLTAKDYRILCDANMDESYSVDGLVVAVSPGISIQPIVINKRTC